MSFYLPPPQQAPPQAPQQSAGDWRAQMARGSSGRQTGPQVGGWPDKGGEAPLWGGYAPGGYGLAPQTAPPGGKQLWDDPAPPQAAPQPAAPKPFRPGMAQPVQPPSQGTPWGSPGGQPSFGPSHPQANPWGPSVGFDMPQSPPIGQSFSPAPRQIATTTVGKPFVPREAQLPPNPNWRDTLPPIAAPTVNPNSVPLAKTQLSRPLYAFNPHLRVGGAMR